VTAEHTFRYRTRGISAPNPVPSCVVSRSSILPTEGKFSWVHVRRAIVAIMRVLLVTGKGGTGKTTVAAATALRTADRGARTLALSTDAAHSLGDSFQLCIGPNLAEVQPNLSAREIDSQVLFDESWTTLRLYLRELLEWAGAERVRAEEFAVLPGLDELLALRAIGAHLSEPWDVVVVDCAPTAETVRLLALPSSLRSYIDRILPLHRRLASSLAPLLRRTSSMPPPPRGVLDALMRLTDEVEELSEALSDPALTSVRLVTSPEATVVAETRRVRSYLALFGYPVDSLVVNRVAPIGTSEGWLQQLRSAQAPHLDAIDEYFSDLRRVEAPICPGDVSGIEALRRFGEATYEDCDELALPASELTEFGRETERANVVRFPVPGANPTDVRVARSGGVMIITIGPHRRSLPLPAHLQGRAATGAQVVDGYLEVEFAQ
jgi:arsenite-transporting ATPase